MHTKNYYESGTQNGCIVKPQHKCDEYMSLAKKEAQTFPFKLSTVLFFVASTNQRISALA